MCSVPVLEYNIGDFCLRTSISGNSPKALAIGSHIYYPRTFSEDLKNKLNLMCMDTRGFVPDNPAHKETHFTLDKIIDDIEGIRIQEGLSNLIIIGHSIHAFMALEYARRLPNRVSHLVLIASAPIAGHKIYKEADRYFEESVCPERKTAFAHRMASFMGSTDQSFIPRMLSFGPRLWYDYSFDAASLWEGVEVNSIGSGIIWGSMFAHYNTEKALQEIQCPIFLALGRYDYFNPPHLWEEYRHKATDLTIRIFEKSGHTPQLEEKRNFDHELLKWLGLAS